MLTRDQALELANLWRPRFHDQEAFETSWLRYMDRYKHNRSPETLERWLRGDAEQDDVRSAGLVREPTLPLAQDVPQLVDDCPTCRGKRWVSRDLPPGHVEFGKALRCPSCGGHPTNSSDPPGPRPVERNRCGQCGAFDDEWAGFACDNPRWHTPNWSSGKFPPLRHVEGWKGLKFSP